MNFSAVCSLQNLSLLLWLYSSKVQIAGFFFFFPLVRFQLKQAIFLTSGFCHFVFFVSLWDRVDWQTPRIRKGDQRAWRADELSLLGNSSCWFYIMLISKNLHEITGSCAETNKALLSVDEKDEGLQDKNNNVNHYLVCDTSWFWCLFTDRSL